MNALTIQFHDEWKNSKGFVKRTMPMPKLREGTSPEDAHAVIVKLRYAGVCGTDRGIWFRNVFGDAIAQSLETEQQSTRIIGHELFGEIVDAGSEARRKGWSIGTNVTAESHVTCGSCYQCLRKEFHVCTQEKILGISFQGCFAEYIKVPEKVLWKTDLSRMKTELACLQEPFGNGVHAATTVPVQEKNIVVLGCGPVGLYVILVARALGAEKIIAVDPLESQRDLARSFGASAAFSPNHESLDFFDEELQRRLIEETDGVGADSVFEMTGFPISINTAIRSARRGGDVILFGLKSGSVTIPNFDRMIVRGITLHSVIGRRISETWEMTQKLFYDTTNHIQELLWQGLLQNGKGTILPFSRYDQAQFETALAKHSKLLFSFTETP